MFCMPVFSTLLTSEAKFVRARAHITTLDSVGSVWIGREAGKRDPRPTRRQARRSPGRRAESVGYHVRRRVGAPHAHLVDSLHRFADLLVVTDIAGDHLNCARDAAGVGRRKTAIKGGCACRRNGFGGGAGLGRIGTSQRTLGSEQGP